MKKYFVVFALTLLSTLAYSQISVLSSGGKIKTNATTQVVSATTSNLTINNQGTNGNITVQFPSVTSGDLQNGACLASGGTFTLNATTPTSLKITGTLGPNGPCTSGPTWELLPEGGGDYSYLISFSVVDGVLTGDCIIRTNDITGLFTGAITIYQMSCTLP